MSNTNLKKLRKAMTSEERNRVDGTYRAYRTAMILGELRTKLNVRQPQLEKALGHAVPFLSQCEIDSDMSVGTIAKMVEQMGGRLEINAIMPDGVVQLVRMKTAPQPIPQAALAE